MDPFDAKQYIRIARVAPCANTAYEVSPESLYVVRILFVLWPRWLVWRFTHHADPRVRELARARLG